MNFLITGGGGYIATKLALFIKSIGEDVTLVTRNPEKLKKELPQVTIYKIKWDDDNNIMDLCDNIDVIIHLAGVNAKNSVIDPFRAWNFNAQTTNRFIKIAINKKVRRFIYFSTAHVYSGNLSGLITEKSDTNGYHPYAYTNRMAESYVLDAGRGGKIESIVIRLANSYGAPVFKEIDCWELLINGLCREVIEKNRLTLKSNGTQHRDFIPIEEVCKASYFLSKINFSTSIKAEIYNIGSGTSTSILEIAKIVKTRAKKLWEVNIPITKPIYSIKENKQEPFQYSNEKLRKLGFKIDNSLETNIDNLLMSCKVFFT